MTGILLVLEDGGPRREFEVALPAEARVEEGGGAIRAVVWEGHRVPVRAVRSGQRVFVWCAGETWELTLGEGSGRRPAFSGEEELRAPMPGKILSARVREGDHVAKGDTLLILEAMKMEHEIRAPRQGRVQRLPYREGEQVEAGAVLVEFAG